MMLMIALLICVLCWKGIDANEFNIFKSYQNAKIKPSQYAKKESNNHDISEYLSKRQRMMLKHRHGKDVPGAMFNEKWSGFDLKANSNPIVTRKLFEITSTNLKWSLDSHSSFIKSYGVLVGAFVLLVICSFVIMSFANRRYAQAKRSDGEEEEQLIVSV